MPNITVIETGLGRETNPFDGNYSPEQYDDFEADVETLPAIDQNGERLPKGWTGEATKRPAHIVGGKRTFWLGHDNPTPGLMDKNNLFWVYVAITQQQEANAAEGNHFYLTTDKGVTAHVNADPNADKETMNALKKMIDLAYEMPSDVETVEQAAIRTYPDSAFKKESGLKRQGFKKGAQWQSQQPTKNSGEWVRVEDVIKTANNFFDGSTVSMVALSYFLDEIKSLTTK